MKLQLYRINTLKLSQLFVYAYCFFLVIFVFNGYEFGAVFETMTIPLIILLVTSFFSHIEFDLLNLVLVIGLIISAVVATYSSTIVSFSQSRIWSFVACCLTYYWISCIRVDENKLHFILSFYVKFSFLLVFWIILGYIFGFGIDSYGRTSINFVEFFKDQNYLSAFFVPSFAICCYRMVYSKGRKVVLNILYMGMIVFAVFTMGSRGSFLTLIMIGTLFVAKIILKDRNFTRKCLLLLFLGVSVIVLYNTLQSLPLFQRMMGFEEYGSDVRIRLWAAALKGFWEHPVLGSGIGAGSVYAWSIVGNATHNSFVELLSDQGGVGTILVFGMSGRVFFSSKKNKFFILLLIVAFFLPLFFLTGYSNFTFWMPMFFVNFITNNLKDKDEIIL